MGIFRHPESADLSASFAKALIESGNLAETLELILPTIGNVFGTRKVILVDYREHSDRFVLLQYNGYPSPDARYELQRRMEEMSLRQALRNRVPYVSGDDGSLLTIPFYFREILEALLVLEYDRRVELTERLAEAAEVVSKTLGLLMSSARLKVNRDQIVDMHDLKQARQIQLSFLPREEMPSNEVCEIFGYNTSSALVGGDYFDYFSKERGSVQGVLADACGHGMTAALIASSFRGLLQSEIARGRQIDGLFDQLNRSVYSGGEYIPYLTCVFFDYDAERRRMHYLNAGHYEPLVIDLDDRIRSLPGGGPPLGMFKGSSYKVEQASLESGDMVVLFTDGLIDIQNAQAEYFGVDGIVDAARGHRSSSLKSLSRRILDHARTFSQGRSIEDDVTLFLMRVQ